MAKINYQTRLKQIIERKKSGAQLTLAEIEDFNKIKRYINSKDYTSYCHAMRPTYNWAWFQKYIMGRINNAVINKGGRIICQMGQQHGKSELFGRMICSYLFGKFPEWKTLYVTFSQDRAEEVSADILGLIASDRYNEVFPKVVLKDAIKEEVRTVHKRTNKLSIANFTNVNSERGEFKAVGIEGSISGYDANLIILDDFFSGPVEYNSPLIREKRWKIFTENILKRQQKDTIILVMSTQWHEDDIIGRLKKYIEIKDPDAPDWEIIIFNAEKDERDYPYDHRKIGEYLWPEERLESYLEAKVIDPIGWQTTMQNMPVSSSGTIFDSTCFRYYGRNETEKLPPLESMRIIISIDPNYKKEAKQGDESAITIWGFTLDRAYLIEYSSVNKVDVMDNINRLKSYMAKYPNYYGMIVEAKAQGEDIITLMNYQGIYKIERYDPTGVSKLFRAQEMIPYCRAGRIWLPSPQDDPTIIRFVNEFMAFNGYEGGKDNCVDSSSQVFVKYKYLLEPLTLLHRDYTIPNKFGVGQGLTKLTNLFAMGYQNAKKKESGRFSTAYRR